MAVFDDKWEKMKRKQSRKSQALQLAQTSASVKIVKVKRPRCYGMKISREKEYFWGRAGLMRVVTLLLSVIALCLGFPGFQGSGKLYIGYGESYLIIASIVLNLICIVISFIFISMLLVFADVRCKPHWDHRNMLINVAQCIMMIASGFCQVVGVQQGRIANCPFSSVPTSCIIDLSIDYPRAALHKSSPYKPPYYELHYAAWLLKIFTAGMFCVCARICLKNDE